ncbi:MAG: efflux RND transporter periplasmic adaptor subunit, partial [Clostridium sp.]
SISVLTGMKGNLGVQNRFSGVVEPQSTLEIKLDTTKTIKELYVKVGQSVEVGTPLFSYDTGEMEMSLNQGKLELDRISNEILSTNRQIATLESEKTNASSEGKLGYAIEIQNLRNSVKRAEYNKTSKELELTKLQKSIDTAIINSTMTGVIKSINKDVNNMEAQGAYITILAVGEYRIKATASEQSIFLLAEGGKVIARSRIDENITWDGIINSIDQENPVAEQNNGMMGSVTNAVPSTKYNFYVALNSFEGLMLGQHVFIELDEGQAATKTGLWLPSYYLEIDGENVWVWVANSKNRLEKRKVSIGEYDDNMDEYEILEGINVEDYIAFPQEGLKEGSDIIKNEGEILE